MGKALLHYSFEGHVCNSFLNNPNKALSPWSKHTQITHIGRVVLWDQLCNITVSIGMQILHFSLFLWFYHVTGKQIMYANLQHMSKAFVNWHVLASAC